MVKNVLFLDTVITLYKGAAKELQSCAQEMGFGWPDVFIIGMAFLFILFLVKLILNKCLQWKTMNIQKKYDLEDQKRKQNLIDEKWNQKKELTKQLLEHLKEKTELNDKYVEVLEKLIGIVNDSNS